MVVALVVVSLAMITGYFRESEGGALHNVQSTAARALEPFQIGAERLVRPFRDAWGWFDGLRTAKSDKERLQAQLDALRKQLAGSRSATAPTTQVAGIQGYAKSPRLADFRLLKADVIADLPSYQQQIVVSAGRIDGIKRYDPVISTRDGVLLGHVSKVTAGSSRVTLISDRDSAVTVYDVETDARGILRGRGPGVGTVTFDRVAKRDRVRASDNVVTAGRLSGDDFSSFYPRGISVGRVDSVTQSDTADFKQIQVQPFADLSSIDTVVILLRKGPLPTLP